MSIWDQLTDFASQYGAQGGAKNPPNTFVQTTHALAIRAKGVTVGMIQSWSPSMARTVVPCLEINLAGDGTPVEKVPGAMSGLTIQVTRYDLYKKRMEAAFGTVDFDMISSQADPIQVLELWRQPDSTMTGWLYVGCWFSNVGRNFSATDGRLVMVNATLEYTRKVRTI